MQKFQPVAAVLNNQDDRMRNSANILSLQEARGRLSFSTWIKIFKKKSNLGFFPDKLQGIFIRRVKRDIKCIVLGNKIISSNFVPVNYFE